jgi:hypothetical protein
MSSKVNIKELQKGICYTYIAFEVFDSDMTMLEYSLHSAQKIIMSMEETSTICLKKVLDELDKMATSDIDSGLPTDVEDTFKSFVFAFEILNKSLESGTHDSFFELAKALIGDEIKRVPNDIIKDINLEANVKKIFDKINR